jgi:hypothetical protein
MKNIYKATLTFECFVSGESKTDAYDKVMRINAKKAINVSRLTKCEIYEQTYEVLDE